MRPGSHSYEIALAAVGLRSYIFSGIIKYRRAEKQKGGQQ